MAETTVIFILQIRKWEAQRGRVTCPRPCRMLGLEPRHSGSRVPALNRWLCSLLRIIWGSISSFVRWIWGWAIFFLNSILGLMRWGTVIASQAFFSHSTWLSSFLPQSTCWNSAFRYHILWHSFYFPYPFSDLNIEEEKQPLNELASQSSFQGSLIQHQAWKKGFPGRNLVKHCRPCLTLWEFTVHVNLLKEPRCSTVEKPIPLWVFKCLPSLFCHGIQSWGSVLLMSPQSWDSGRL